MFISKSIPTLIDNYPLTLVSTLIAHVKSIEGYTTTYRKAWLAKHKVIENIYGNGEKSYHKLSKLLQAMQTYLPSMVIEKETLSILTKQGTIEGVFKFHRLFWSFRPCINKFQYCKPVVQVDGSWLYKKYKGSLLVAVAQDVNNKILPIVFIVVEGETTEAWFFFLNNLKRHVTPQNGLRLISDKHKPIKSAYSRWDSGWTPENSMHVFCIRNITQNFTMKYKNNDIKKIDYQYG